MAVLIFGHLLWGITLSGTLGIGGGWLPWRGQSQVQIDGLKSLAQVLHWATYALTLLLLVQIACELRRPKLERVVRRARLASDLLALFVMVFILAIPWQLDNLINMIQVEIPEVVHNFEYDPGDQEWHWVPPKPAN